MKRLHQIVITLVLAMTAVLVPAVITQDASATTASACTVTASRPNVGTVIPGRKFTTDGTNLFVKVTIAGNNCNEPLTFASWTAPNPTDGRPYSAQHVYQRVTKYFSAGSYVMKVQLPDCYYQADLYRGTKVLGVNGEGKFDKDLFLGSVHGGTGVCETTPPPVTPPTPPTPPTTVVTTETPKTLPNTGNSAAVISLTTIAVAVASTIAFRRRLLRKS